MQTDASHHSKESGAIVGFFIMLLVLLGLLAGGFWFIKNRSDIAANTQTAVTEVKDEAKKEADKPAEGTPPSTSNDTQSTQSSSGTQPQGQTPKPTGTTPSSTGQSATPAPAATTRVDSVATTGPSHIASTGPEDVIGNAFLLASLVIVGHLYRQSRRHSA